MKDWLFILSIPVAIFAVYWRTLWNYYIIDDFTAYKDVKVRPKGKFARFWGNLTSKVYSDEDSKKIGVNKQAHAQTLAIHSLACIMIYLAFGRTTTAYLAAMYFAFNSGNNEVSIWLSGKAYGWTTALILFGWIIPLSAPVIYILLNRVLFFNAITAPLIYLTLSGWYKLLALLFVGIFFLKGRDVFNPKVNVKLAAFVEEKTYVVQNRTAISFHPRNLVRAIKFYGYYLVNCIFATKLAFFRSYLSEFATSKEEAKRCNKPDKYFWIGLFVLFILIAGLIWPQYLSEGGRNAIFGLLWFTINIAPVCNYPNLGQQPITSRYAYLPCVGIMWMCANLLIGYPFLAGGLLCWYLRILPFVMHFYKNDYWHNTYETIFEPKYYYSWLLHGNMFFARAQFTTALQDYKEALTWNPVSFKVFYNMANAYIAIAVMNQRNPERALEQISGAVVSLEKAKLCSMLGQESLKEKWVSEREIMIGKIIEMLNRKIKIDLKLEEIPIVV
jgi:hypothetical protein